MQTCSRRIALGSSLRLRGSVTSPPPTSPTGTRNSWRQGTMKFAKISITTFVTAAMVAGLSVTPANADSSEGTPPIRPSTAVVQEALLSATDAMNTLDALENVQTQNLIAANAPQLATESGLNLSLEEATSWAVDRDTTLVRIPIAAGQGVVDPSAMALFLGRDGEVVSVVETTFTPATASTGVVRAWVDGTLQVDRVVGEPSALGDSTVAPAATVGSPTWWSTLNSCLASQGIPAWILAGLSIICAAACVATAGAGCLVCLAAASGFGGGIVGGCIYQAGRA